VSLSLLYRLLVLLLISSLALVGCYEPLALEPHTDGLLQVHYIDVGQGDAILILTPDGKAALIDGGEARSGALQYLRDQGVRKLDLVVVTHPHDDHIGGLPEIFKAIPVSKVATNGQPHTTLSYERLLEAVIDSQAEYLEVKRGDSLAVGSLELQVLHPGEKMVESHNENSVVLLMGYGNMTFLFTGDAERGAEQSILASGYPVKATVLKVGHHGSRSSSSPDFLASVRPEIAIFSAKAGNLYGHPHSETLDALTAVGSVVYGTDRYGSIVIRTDGRSYEILSEQANFTNEQLFLDILSITTPVAPGGIAELTARTAPGANSRIVVYTRSGTSQAQGLEPQIAGNDGLVTWSWRVGSSTFEGEYRIEVTASLGGETMNTETTYKVRR
jgi:competence protein ComEC